MADSIISMKNPTRPGTRGYASLAEIDAPLARVWRALTDPDLIRIWSGAPAEVDPRKGGLYRLGVGERCREAHIDVFDVNRRLRLIYLGDPGMPSSASAVVDDFLLDPRKGAGTTSLRLLGSGISDAPEWDAMYKRCRIAWERNLARIKVALENPPRPKLARPPPGDAPLRGLDC